MIPARTSADDAETVLARLAVLREIKAQRPDIVISAVSIIMRASDSYSPVEEPDYWALYGRSLRAFGATIHRRDGSVEVDPAVSTTDVPPEIIADLARRRLRNHLVNLMAVEMHEAGAIDFLAITADPDGMARVAPFENAPLSEAVTRQILAVGAVTTHGTADITLLIHAPDPNRQDQAGLAAPAPDDPAAERTCAAVADALNAGRSVALADVRYSNGADPLLVEKLIARGLLGRLTAFGGWNTAGNTLGGVIATAVADVVGSISERNTAEARPRALARRVLDDYAFQSIVRHRGDPAVFAGSFPILPVDQAAQAAEWVAKELRTVLAAELPFPGWLITSVELPWNRGFEVEIELEYNSRSAVRN